MALHLHQTPCQRLLNSYDGYQKTVLYGYYVSVQYPNQLRFQPLVLCQFAEILKCMYQCYDDWCAVVMLLRGKLIVYHYSHR